MLLCVDTTLTFYHCRCILLARLVRTGIAISINRLVIVARGQDISTPQSIRGLHPWRGLPYTLPEAYSGRREVCLKNFHLYWPKLIFCSAKWYRRVCYQKFISAPTTIKPKARVLEPYSYRVVCWSKFLCGLLDVNNLIFTIFFSYLGSSWRRVFRHFKPLKQMLLARLTPNQKD